MTANFDRYFERNGSFETDYIKVWHHHLDANFKGRYKSFQYPRLCTLLSGEKSVRINEGSVFAYSPSEFILLPPYSSVEVSIKENTIAVVYEISDKLIEDVASKVKLQIDASLDVADYYGKKIEMPEPMKNHIDRINEYAMSSDPNKSFLVDLCAQELAYYLVQNYKLPVGMKKEADPIAYVIHHLKTRLDDPNVTMKEIAENLNMSPSNLVLIFRKATGMTPKHYHNMLKLNRAKELLRQHNVSEVCYALGFVSNSHFIQLFKKQFGLTPKQYALTQRSAEA